MGESLAAEGGENGCAPGQHAWTEWTGMPRGTSGLEGWFRTCTAGTCTAMDMDYDPTRHPSSPVLVRLPPRQRIDRAWTLLRPLVDELLADCVDDREKWATGLGLLIAMDLAVDELRQDPS